MSTLTDRYVWAAVRSIPEKQRGELEPELRGLIADTADAQREKGVADADVERATLLELGDPERLAAILSRHMAESWNRVRDSI